MRFVIANRNHLAREGLVWDTHIEIARLVARDNNVQLEDLALTLDVGGGWQSAAPNFDRSKVYFATRLLVSQRVDGGIIVNTGWMDARRYVLLMNIPSGRAVGNLVQNVYMRYVGSFPFRQADGGIISVPGFDVLFHH